MSTRDRVGVMRAPVPTLPQLEQIRSDRVAQALDALPCVRDGVLLTGVKDSEGKLSDGISIVATGHVELAHGLGHACSGFIVVDIQGGAAAVRRDQANISTGLANTHIRLVNDSAATSTRIKVVVW